MHGANYRHPTGMPYVRKEFMRGTPQPKIARFSTGKISPDHDLVIRLVSKGRVQIRHNALEAARVAANKVLTPIGEDKYFLAVKVYPHVVLRENKMIATAGADRLQEGMRRAFGKPVGLAARIGIGQPILEVSISSSNREIARKAFATASSKLPVRTYLEEIRGGRQESGAPPE